MDSLESKDIKDNEENIEETYIKSNKAKCEDEVEEE